MNCVQCGARLTEDEEINRSKDGHYTDSCFMCLFGDPKGEDAAMDDVDWDYYYDADQGVFQDP